MPNLMMPGDPRDQPESLISYFGYDHLVKPMVEVELALLESLAEIQFMPKTTARLLTKRLASRFDELTMTEVDRRERKTRHDVQALIDRMTARLPSSIRPQLRPWIHFTATSFDVRDTAMILAYRRAYVNVTRPSALTLLTALEKLAEGFMEVKQIGRTHGQHAIPITVGFWLATILSRILDCLQRLDRQAEALVGKMSGVVGACNAQVLFGLTSSGMKPTFEERVLAKLGVKPAPVSTQILPPEPLADFLHGHVLLAGAVAQWADDCRQLMRTEIDEVGELFGKGQTGSSSMSHKRNPKTFEGIVGRATKAKDAYFKVLDTLTSEHQRDLRGSTISRQFPEVVVHTQTTLEMAVKAATKFTVNREALEENLARKQHVFMSEPLQLALRQAGFKGNAHAFVNHQVVPRAGINFPIEMVVQALAKRNAKLRSAVHRIPSRIWEALENPMQYTGLSEHKARETILRVRRYVRTTPAQQQAKSSKGER